jgi:hypothetical protein
MCVIVIVIIKVGNRYLSQCFVSLHSRQLDNNTTTFSFVSPRYGCCVVAIFVASSTSNKQVLVSIVPS